MGLFLVRCLVPDQRDNLKSRRELRFATTRHTLQTPISDRENRKTSSFRNSFRNFFQSCFRSVITDSRLRKLSTMSVISSIEIPEIIEFPTLGLEGLLEETDFTKEELQRMYRGFKTECSEGLIDRNTFVSIQYLLYPDGDPKVYADRLFTSFDRSNRGKLNFEDFVIGLSKCLHGTCADKLRWAFKLYDLDGNGLIGRNELFTVATGIYALQKGKSNNAAEVNFHIDKLFKMLDVNNDGYISEEEFVETCLKNEPLIAVLSEPFHSTHIRIEYPRSISEFRGPIKSQHSEDINEHMSRLSVRSPFNEKHLMRQRKISSETTASQLSASTIL
ncbi:calsenilin-like [Hydra vulgaris]|uniref:Calsenilin-like n=1 Tax=Hydra vulgaris TaxID=6087 RepID=A0ABM4BVR8_HYDVU